MSDSDPAQRMALAAHADWPEGRAIAFAHLQRLLAALGALRFGQSECRYVDRA